MSLPTIVPASQTTVFNFYRDSAIYEGMNFKGRLYKRVRLYSSQERLKAFEQACDLSISGDVILTTKSEKDDYILWIDVRADVDCMPVSLVGLAATEHLDPLGKFTPAIA